MNWGPCHARKFGDWFYNDHDLPVSSNGYSDLDLEVLSKPIQQPGKPNLLGWAEGDSGGDVSVAGREPDSNGRVGTDFYDPWRV